MDETIKPIDPVNFEKFWDSLSEQEQIDSIKAAADLKPEQAILPVIAGIDSYHFSVRNEGKKGLENIQIKIEQQLSDPVDKIDYEAGLKISESVCNRIYNQINPEMSINELTYFFKTLIEFGGKGPYFALKAVYQGNISVTSMSKMINTVSQKGRLKFVDQYLEMPPHVRLTFGSSFKKILKSISERQAVIEFYSDLFDRQKDADPFLNNIDPMLLDSDQIIAKELTSPSPEIKIRGLKALSMIITDVPSEILLDILSTEEVKKVRVAIYSIIENSSHGLYADLYYPLLELFYKCKKQEAFFVFKALVVTGKVPLYTLLNIVRDKYPAILPDINIEIASLSKLSFFVIQDIALNREKYLDENLEINRACVLGMIKKRPERVVKILKKYDNDSKDSLRVHVHKFIDKTRQLLSSEKADIETQFDDIIEEAIRPSKESKGLLNAFFSTPLEKKIDQLLSNQIADPIDFEGEKLQDIDFSACAYLASPLFFNKSVITNCDLSNASFFNSYFKETIFYNVDIQDSQFDQACFDGAVFINVNAKGAVFSNSSFQEVKIFNCNFNNASIQDASFLNSIISKTSFNRSNLFCSSFSFARISAVSFVTSNLDQTDFSHVKARFCRFPSSSRSIIKNDGIHYNSRKFQLSFSDMPQMDQKIIKEINMMIFSEFIHYGENKFLKQNKLSMLTAFDIFKPTQAELFLLIPLLLHKNLAYPGLEDVDDKTPCGIYDYEPNRETCFIIQKYLKIETSELLNRKKNSIQGLFSIGSIGSIAQTSDSDIDYWVCINESDFSVSDLKKLNQKLTLLGEMAQDQFKTQVTFFLVDIVKAKNNDFGDSTIESSGSAQSRILKEEFYRTMIYVAGKIPLWSVLPTAISLNYYNAISDHVSSLPKMSRYIDLGDIHAISTSEYFGASIWQMFKWLKSPFKSVIKMALLEKYIYEYGKEYLLCNKYKDEWMNSGTHLKLAQNDSYYILLKNLLLYYSKAKDKESVSLLLTCFFLKLSLSKDSQIENTIFGLRQILLNKCLSKWGWKKENVYNIGSYKSWQYTDIAKLSTTIEKYMVKKYKTVNKAFDSLFHGKSQISAEDRTVLGRKVYIEFSKPAGKVEKVLLVSRSDRHFQGLHLMYLNPSHTVGFWQLINKNTTISHEEDEILVKAKTIEEIGAWLINNGLYSESVTINLIPNPTFVTFDDIRKLYQAMNDFFSTQLKQVVDFDKLLLKSRVSRLFISINFYAPRQQNRVTEYTVVYLTSWGEMFCKSVYLENGFANLDTVKTDIMKRVGLKKLPKETAFYFSKGVSR